VSFRWLNNVSGVFLVQVSLLLIGQPGLGQFFKYRSLTGGLGNTPTPEENDQYSANHSWCNTSIKPIPFTFVIFFLNYLPRQSLQIFGEKCITAVCQSWVKNPVGGGGGGGVGEGVEIFADK
jgi:hypothetical protein